MNIEQYLLELIEEYSSENIYSNPSGIQVKEARITVGGWEINVSLEAVTINRHNVSSVSDEGNLTTSSITSTNKVKTFHVSYMKAAYERRGSYNPTTQEVEQFLSEMKCSI